MGHRLQSQGCVCVSKVQRPGRVGKDCLFRSQRFGGREQNFRQKAEGTKKKPGCAREINSPLRHERNMFNYFLLHFILMYMPYLAACKPQITQRESIMKNKRIKNTDKKMLLKLESRRERSRSQIRHKRGRLALRPTQH